MAINEFLKLHASTLPMRVFYGNAAPTAGTYVAGDSVINSSMAAGGPEKWICVTGGSPGTWKAIYPVGDNGTATATTGAATLSRRAGVITSESLTTAAAGVYTLTLTNTLIAATSVVVASVQNGTNSQGIPVVSLITPGSGSCTIDVRNLHGSQALNGTIKIAFAIQ